MRIFFQFFQINQDYPRQYSSSNQVVLDGFSTEHIIFTETYIFELYTTQSRTDNGVFRIFITQEMICCRIQQQQVCVIQELSWLIVKNTEGENIDDQQTDLNAPAEVEIKILFQIFKSTNSTAVLEIDSPVIFVSSPYNYSPLLQGSSEQKHPKKSKSILTKSEKISLLYLVSIQFPYQKYVRQAVVGGQVDVLIDSGVPYLNTAAMYVIPSLPVNGFTSAVSKTLVTKSKQDYLLFFLLKKTKKSGPLGYVTKFQKYQVNFVHFAYMFQNVRNTLLKNSKIDKLPSSNQFIQVLLQLQIGVSSKQQYFLNFKIMIGTFFALWIHKGQFYPRPISSGNIGVFPHFGQEKYEDAAVSSIVKYNLIGRIDKEIGTLSFLRADIKEFQLLRINSKICI
ncbi:UNKNOWN [Stylonychia lemnae]|uniref:Uncharacterized protein n=1 Tax=Stylonychia lemnae TaxID=5949 RepID=A0A078A5S7_STYLE|nr:UNKNOWN [Stylonychia lemnae]|eukprot:CDW77261.1 UNKNOWN [Stylonychia lemnae]